MKVVSHKFKQQANAGALMLTMFEAHAADPAYLAKYDSLRMTRHAQSELLVEMHSQGGLIMFSARDHDQFVDAFYDIGRYRGNKVVILTDKRCQWMAKVDFDGFDDVSDPDVWAFSC